jgi:dephospho-CoA kinase
VGIVGSIGSGKTAVSSGIAERLGGLRLDADGLGHALLADPEVKDLLRREFGTEIFQADGTVCRRALARLVFGQTTDQQRLRNILEGILHPRIRQEIHRSILEANQSGTVSVIVLDAAVMLEAGWEGECDALICIDAPRPLRLQRVAGRGWDQDELTRRELNQWSVEEKSRRADITLQNDQGLQVAVDQAVQFLVERFPQLERPAVEMV